MHHLNTLLMNGKNIASAAPIVATARVTALLLAECVTA